MTSNRVLNVKAGLLIALFAIGALVGDAFSGAYAPVTAQETPSADSPTCAETQCNGWWIWRKCRENDGRTTKCVVDNGDECATDGCFRPRTT